MNALLLDVRRHGWRTALLGGTGLRDVGRLEGFGLRLLFAVVVWRSLEFYPTYPSLPKPVGLAAWPALWEALGWDLSRLADPTFWSQCLLGARLALICYVLGVALPVALPFLALLHIAIRTLNNSQGAAHHGFQMVSLTLLTQALVVWFLAGSRTLAKMRRRPAPTWAAPGNWTWLWLYTIAIAAATYTVSVCSKWDESRGQWLKNSPYVATEIVKTHRQNFYNNLDHTFIEGVPPAASPATADPATDRYRHRIPPAADWLMRHPDLARILFGAGFFLELLAVLAVFDRRAALVIGLSLVALHGSIEWLMELSFPFNERTVGVFFVNAFGWFILMLRDPAWWPSRRLWMGSLLGAAALLAAHLGTGPSPSPGAQFLALLQHPAALVPDLFAWPTAGKWAWILLTQTVLLAALTMSARSLLPGKRPVAGEGPNGRPH